MAQSDGILEADPHELVCTKQHRRSWNGTRLHPNPLGCHPISQSVQGRRGEEVLTGDFKGHRNSREVEQRELQTVLWLQWESWQGV